MTPASSVVLERRCALVAVIVGLVVALPPLRFVLEGANLAAYYSENFGYRYFPAMRMIAANDLFTDLLQGPLLPLFHKILYLLLAPESGDHAEQIVARINAFGYWTYAASAWCLLAALAWIGTDRSLPPATRQAICLAPLGFSFTYEIGFEYNLYPDYVRFAQVFAVLALHNLARLAFALGERRPLKSILAQGAILSGFALSLKPTYGVLLPVCVSCFLVGARPLGFMRGTIHALAGFAWRSLLVWAAVLLTTYEFNVRDSIHHVRNLANFVGGRSRDPGFERELLDVFASWTGHTYSVFWWFVIGAALALTLLVRSRREGTWRGTALGITSGLVLSCALFAAGMIKRGGGASFFDAMLVLVGTLALAAGLVGGTSHTALAYRLLIGFFLALPVAWTLSHARYVWSNAGILDRLVADKPMDGVTPWNQQVFDWSRSHGLPVFTLMPSNSYAVGTVEDMVMRGMTDSFVDNWYVSNRHPARARFFPLHYFVSYDVARIADGSLQAYGSPPAAKYVFVWTESLAPRSGLPSVDEDRHHREYLEREGYWGLKGSDHCRTWMAPATGMRVWSCVVASR